MARVVSSVSEVQPVPSNLHALYIAFPHFYQTIESAMIVPDARCQMEQRLWWGNDLAFQVSSAVHGTFSELVPPE